MENVVSAGENALVTRDAGEWEWVLCARRALCAWPKWTTDLAPPTTISGNRPTGEDLSVNG
jgi:hypothetical protein